MPVAKKRATALNYNSYIQFFIRFIKYKNHAMKIDYVGENHSITLGIITVGPVDESTPAFFPFKETCVSDS